jgi:ubiquitin-like protein ATG12
LKQTRFKITSTQPFAAVVTFLRKKLKVREGDSLWCYIDNFAPAPDEGVGGLFNVGYFTIPPLKITIVDMHQCFKKGEELKVGYSITPTFG